MEEENKQLKEENKQLKEHSVHNQTEVLYIKSDEECTCQNVNNTQTISN